MTAPFSDIAHGASVPYNQSITTGLSSMAANVEGIIPEPRIGFVYTLGSSKKTVIRGGGGIFSDQPPATLVSSIFANSPNIYTPSVRQGLVGTAALAGSSAATAVASNSAFRSGFANGYTLAQIKASLPAGVSFTPPAYFSLPNTLLSPKYAEWSFEIQREFGSKNIVTASYTGNHGYNLFLENQMLNTYNQNGLAAYSFLPTAPVDPRFRIITNLQNDGISNYNGLNLQFRRAFGAGFQGQINYNYAHALDDISNGGLREFFSANDSLTTQLYPYNKSLNYSNSDYDIRHNVTGDFSWDIPMTSSNHFMKGAFGGWNMASKVYARTGTPFSVTLASQSGKISSSTGGSILAYITDPNVNTSCGTGAVNTPCFTPSEFTTNGFGNYPRNLFRGPGYFDIDYSVMKNVPIRERIHLAIGASFYNILNHPNFANPNHVIGAGGEGSITSTVVAPTSAYGSFQGAAVSGRVIVTSARITF